MRSLTVVIAKTVANELAEGYPRTYYGRSAFTWNSVYYQPLTDEELSVMSVNSYVTRLNAFKAYVESQEAGLVINDVQQNQPYY